MKKAQEVQKKAREEAKRLKESTREPGVRDRIKAANNGESAEDRSLQPPGFIHLSNSSKSSTHHNGDIALSKSKLKSNAKGDENPYEGTFDFGSDNDGNATSQPNSKPQSPPRNDLFDFGWYDDGPQLNLEDNEMEIDLVEPYTQTVVHSKLKTNKKAVVSGSGLAKSGNAGGGMLMGAGEKGGKVVTQLMVKEGDIHRQVTLSYRYRDLSLLIRCRPIRVRSAHLPPEKSLSCMQQGKFFLSNNDKSGPPSKKRKAEHDPITAWIDHVQPNAPPPSRAASSSSKNTSRTVTSSRRPPSLTAGSTRSSNSTLTNTI